MDTDHQAQIAFFLTGRLPGAQLDAVEGLGLRPALFAGYRDLTGLRYDFPLVLVAGRSDGLYAQSLSALVDGALATLKPGIDSERTSKQVLRLEQEMRARAASGTAGSLAALWEEAVAKLAQGADKAVTEGLKRVRAAFKCEGEVVDCDESLPLRLVKHGWEAVQKEKASSFRKDLDRLTTRLSDILKADDERSEAGRSVQHLQATVGAGYAEAFDFEAMSRLLAQSLPKDEFPESRRKRIKGLLEVLRGQQFFPAAATGGAKPYSFLYESCADALQAFRERMPRLIELAKAITVAELEIDGQYNEEKHDPLFEQFGAAGLDPKELAPFPDYLVSVNVAKLSAAEQSRLMEILSSSLPIKVLYQLDDILEETPDGDSGLTAGTRGRQIANMAVGLNQVYVLQSASSHLYQFRDGLLAGLNYRGPALFSVYSGASGRRSGLPPYLMAAAAMESRAFPAFIYDPSAGANWASRFFLAGNSQLDLDWPIQSFAYEDEEHQRVAADLAFTFADFVASDARFAKHLARVPRAKWNGSMVAVDEQVSKERKGLPDKVPSLMMVDRENVLQRVIVDETLIREARRCREMWHSLQELGGIHNSHAEKLLAREKKAWEERMQKEAEAHTAKAPAAAPTAAPAAASAAMAVAEPEPQRSADEAYIETERCSTCNECTQINNKLFAYNENKQAYIADINAGTYAQLVEAAEACQVAVIHPGKPHNPNEPGLDDLLKRAEPFL